MRAAVLAAVVAAGLAVLSACGASARSATPGASSAAAARAASPSAVRPPAGPRSPTLPSALDGQLTVTSSQQIDARLTELTVTSAAIDGALHIRVLLPTGYDQSQQRYPVIYLLPGTGDSAATWTDQGDAEAITAGQPAIVVMPDLAVDGGGGSYCSDWYNGGRYGKPMWETFEVDQVIPFIDRTYRTRATRAGRAIFGVSQGGFCALSLAARHPDTYAAAGSFSGVIDMTSDSVAIAAGDRETRQTTGLDHVSDPYAIFGPRSTQEINWAAHDPTALVSNLRGTRLWAYAGNGVQGPLYPSPDYDVGDEVEVHGLTLRFKTAAARAHVPATIVTYAPGSHNWPYWQRDLRWVLGPLMAVLDGPPAAPVRKAYTTVDDPWAQWGYTVSIARPAREFSALSHGTRAGFDLAGSGTATVLTPRQYRPGAQERVRERGPHVDRSFVVRASRAGRLQLTVPLGPANRFQQDTSAARAAGGTRVFTTRVAISRAR